jgi:adenine-specific DNA-methyltransferase
MPVSHSEHQLARYGEIDNTGPFEWVNFRKHGGTNANRTARPRLFYPIYASADGELRIPVIDWDEDSQQWNTLEEPLSGEVVVWPVNLKGEEKTWKWGHETALNTMSDLCSKPDQTGELGIYMKSRLQEEGTLPPTWWDKKKYSATDYGTNLLTSVLVNRKFYSFPKSIHRLKIA